MLGRRNACAHGCRRITNQRRFAQRHTREKHHGTTTVRRRWARLLRRRPCIARQRWLPAPWSWGCLLHGGLCRHHDHAAETTWELPTTDPGFVTLIWCGLLVVTNCLIDRMRIGQSTSEYGNTSRQERELRGETDLPPTTSAKWPVPTPNVGHSGDGKGGYHGASAPVCTWG